MRFESIFAGAALVAAAIAQNLAINSYPSSGVVAGQTYEVTYSPADNTPTTFILRQGPSNNLNTVDTLTTSATGGKFSWTVDGDLPNHADYALEIRRGDQVNYSGQFGLTGGEAAVSSPGASATATASVSAASSAASASAALSSAIASAVSSIQASVTIGPSAGLNSTITTASLTRSATATGRPNATTTAGVPESTGAAASMAGSPIAAIFGAIAAFAYLA